MSDTLQGLPFTMAPVALIESPLSAQAVRVFLAIQSHSSASGPVPFPSIARIATMCSVSKATVKRSMVELRSSGFLEVFPRTRDNGSRTSNGYALLLPNTPAHPWTGDGFTREPGMGSSVNLSEGDSKELEPKNQTPLPPARRKVGCKQIAREELALALEILRVWNREAKQGLTANSWVDKIVLRIREHPELSVTDHEHVIAANLADPWWSGPSNPSVVYGNDAQFERAMLVVHQSGNVKPGRFGRGMTTDQILAMANEARRRGD